MKNNVGFSLIELMVAIAIFAILSSIAIPNIISWRNNAQVNSAARGLYSDLQSARSMAVRENRVYEVSFDADGYTIRNTERDIKSISIYEYGSVTLGAVTGPSTIFFQPTGFSFDGDGALSGLSVILQGKADRTVVLEPGGSIRIEYN